MTSRLSSAAQQEMLSASPFCSRRKWGLRLQEAAAARPQTQFRGAARAAPRGSAGRRLGRGRRGGGCPPFAMARFPPRARGRPCAEPAGRNARRSLASGRPQRLHKRGHRVRWAKSVGRLPEWSGPCWIMLTTEGPAQTSGHLDSVHSVSFHKALAGNLLFNPLSNCHLLGCGNTMCMFSAKHQPRAGVGRRGYTLRQSHYTSIIAVFI